MVGDLLDGPLYGYSVHMDIEDVHENGHFDGGSVQGVVFSVHLSDLQNTPVRRGQYGIFPVGMVSLGIPEKVDDEKRNEAGYDGEGRPP